ncbi:flavin reductase family protein [Phytohabitans sp. ZYX-F-186]|uniref:Flavin reductase family protein n=1 Tax=Phytohabitans maris TaxID=3071409 RepID=A0ABU0ZTI3_9ACTN|nr:flavin reductase family protein [Phytohabitans sp. ZYX-F-186]MDQ7910101.1 flavin reductase family protein [Phytohabitans sp. ZYX-F-186]
MTARQAPAVDPLLLRRAMGHFTTGVAIVTAYADGAAHGMTVNSLTSVALDPPLILVCLTTGARTTTAVEASGRFAISILSARQERLAVRFARRGEQHFDGLPLTFGALGTPVVPDALAQLECVVENRVPAGDHLVLIGHVLAARFRPGEPLAFFGGRFHALTGGDGTGWFR